MLGINILKSISVAYLFLSLPTQCFSNVKLVNIQCRSLNLQIGTFEKCFFKAVKRDVTELSVLFKLDQIINKFSISLKLTKRGDRITNAIHEYRVDLCKFLSNKRRHPLAEIFAGLFGFEKYSNVNHSCPIDHNIIIDRSRLETKLLDLLAIPHGDYTINTMFFINHKASMNVNVSVRVF